MTCYLLSQDSDATFVTLWSRAGSSVKRRPSLKSEPTSDVTHGERVKFPERIRSMYFPVRCESQFTRAGTRVERQMTFRC